MKRIIAIVGMPGAGKTEAAEYLATYGIPFVRFGEITEEEVKKRGLKLTPENERIVREAIRKENGMGAFALKAEPKINPALLSVFKVRYLRKIYHYRLLSLDKISSDSPF